MSAEEHLIKYQKEKRISRIYLDENLKPDIVRIMESYAREYHAKEMERVLGEAVLKSKEREELMPNKSAYLHLLELRAYLSHLKEQKQ